MLIACHSIALTHADGAPEWIHLIPAGTFHGVDGRGPYRVTDAAALIANSFHDADKLPIDENHAIDIAAPKGEPSPARGYIVELAAREDGIWGRVEWTPAGQALMADHAYRAISPVFEHDKSGRVLRLARAALTNNPNLTQLTALHHNQDSGMDLIARLRAALGQPEADEEAIVTAVTANATAVATHASTLASIAQAAGVTASGGKAPDGNTIVLALQARAGDPADAAKLQATVIALQTKLNTLEAGAAEARAIAFVDGAIKDGKPINAIRDRLIAQHQKDPEGVEALVAGLVSINAGGVPGGGKGAPGGAAGELTTEERHTCQKMGLDPAKFLEHRKGREAAAREGATA